MSWLAFRLRRDGARPMFAQITDALRDRIRTGALPPGARLPASRALAEELAVSRTTVVTAYEQLTAEGYVEGRRGSGVYVADMGATEPLPDPARRPGAPPVSAPPPAPAADGPRPFLHGVPDMRLFPYRPWARRLARVARTRPELTIRRGDPFGDPALRGEIARHLADWRGVDAAPEHILITAGSVDALDICIRTLAPPGARIGLEDPGYPPLRRFVESLGLRPVWLDIDGDGARVPDARPDRAPALAVVTPSHQFPLGGAMPAGRRLDFAAWAARSGAWIVEDDYDSEFRYAGRPIPALAGFDRGGRTIYVGGFSKIFSAGLRIGYMAMPPGLAGPVRETLARYGTRASMAPQRALALFMADGELTRHLRRMRRIYGERRRVLLDALAPTLDALAPRAWVEDHQAGMQIALRLADGLDDAALSAACARAGITAEPLSAYAARARTPKGLLLGFCAFDADEIRCAAAALSRVLARRLG